MFARLIKKIRELESALNLLSQAAAAVEELFNINKIINDI